MNQRGVWQLVLMAQEGDRKAVDELFYMTYRSAYLVAYSVTKSKKASLDILLESYVSLLSGLSELDEAIDFFTALNLRVLERVKTLAGSDRLVRIDKHDAVMANDWHPEIFTVYDFETLPGIESDKPANDVLELFMKLDPGRSLCSLLFLYADLSTADIGRAVGVPELVVKGALCSSVQETMPLIEDIQEKYPQLGRLTPESVIPWSLRHNTAYSPDEAELKAFYVRLLERLVEANVLDTAMTEEDVDELIDIDIKDMKPLPAPGFLKSKAFSRLVIAAVFLLVIFGIYLGIERVRDYNSMRAEIEQQTRRTTIKYSMSVIPTDNLIFSTEYDQTSGETQDETTQTEASTETTTNETTTKPPEDTGGLSYAESGSAVTIIGFDNSSTAVSIPETINDKPVTAIAENAFFNSIVETVSMPNTITSIGPGAFYSCTSLRSISVSSGVTKLMENTFRGCSSLTSVTLPNKLNFISSQAFYKCSALAQLVIPSSVTYLGDWAFANCSKLRTISVPDGVTYVGQSLFYECTALERVTFSSASQLTGLNEWMFFSCSSLKAFAIPAKVTYIPANCFYGCRGLERMTLSNKIAAVDANAFTDCTNLISVAIPGSVKKIDSGAFSGCIKLSQLNLQSGTTTIGPNAFSGCSGLISALIPASVTSIGVGAFSECVSLTIKCAPGSYAEGYAVSNSIKCITT